MRSLLVCLSCFIVCVAAYPTQPWGTYPGYGGWPFGGGGGYGGQYPGYGYGGYNMGGFGGYGGYNMGGYGGQYQAVAPAKPRENYMWICLEDIFPKQVTMAAGIPSDVGDILSTYMTHAYILHGPTVNEATAWQVQLDEGQKFWTKVLLDARNIDRSNQIEWGKKKAESIQGRTKISTVSGSFVFAHSEKCFRTAQPVKCSSADLQAHSNSYYHEHPRFNLLKENCVKYACSMLQSCSSSSDCSVDSCATGLMFAPMSQKSPTCSTTEEPKSANNYGHSFEQQNYGFSPFQLKEIMPMHDPELVTLLAASH